MLHPSATLEVITAVYRALAKHHHPDHAGPSGQKRMAQINEAYTVLSDPDKRARYDESLGLGQPAVTQGLARPAAPRGHEPQVPGWLVVRARRGRAHAGLLLLRRGRSAPVVPDGRAAASSPSGGIAAGRSPRSWRMTATTSSG